MWKNETRWRLEVFLSGKHYFCLLQTVFGKSSLAATEQRHAASVTPLTGLLECDAWRVIHSPSFFPFPKASLWALPQTDIWDDPKDLGNISSSMPGDILSVMSRTYGGNVSLLSFPHSGCYRCLNATILQLSYTLRMCLRYKSAIMHSLAIHGTLLTKHFSNSRFCFGKILNEINGPKIFGWRPW